MRDDIIISCLIALLFLIHGTVSFAASVSISPSGNPASYSINGTGMDGVAGIQLDVTYDAGSLGGTPAVTQGALVSGAMLAVNTVRPGLIKIAIISTRPFSGSGAIATITFASKSASAANPTLTYSMIDSKGSTITASGATGSSSSDTVTGMITAPGVPFSDQQQQSSSVPQQKSNSTVTTSTTTTATSPASTSIPTYLGTVTMPSDVQQRNEKSTTLPAAPATSATPTSAPGDEPSAPPRSAAETQPVKPEDFVKSDEAPQSVAYMGILDRFKEYGGNKLLPDMAALFDREVAHAIHQEPAILVNNGKNKATLMVDIPVNKSTSLSFAVNGGTLLSYKKDTSVEGRWICEVLPDAGALRVTAVVMAGAGIFEYPLTVVSPTKISVSLDNQGWSRFLKETGTPAAPLHDLNNDGKRDYIDEFIFVAQYLLQKPTPPKGGAEAKKTK